MHRYRDRKMGGQYGFIQIYRWVSMKQKKDRYRQGCIDIIIDIDKVAYV